MTKDLKARLNRAIQESIGRQRGAFTGGDVAASLKRADGDLWDEAREVLATDKVIAIANSIIRGPLHQANSSQMELAGSEDIPKYIRAGKRWLEIHDANAAELKEFAEWYRKRLEGAAKKTERDKRILTNVERLIRIVNRYERGTPGITLGTVLDMREVKAELAKFRARRSRRRAD